MKTRLVVIVLAFAAVAFAGVWVWPVMAQQGREVRWEYCYLGHATLGEGPRSGQYIARVTYFTPRGLKVTDVERGELLVDSEGKGASPARSDDTMAVIAHAMARLGAEGWELVALPADGRGVFFGNGAVFKRRLQ